MAKTLLDKVLKIAVILTGVAFVILVIWYIIGESPGLEDIVFMLAINFSTTLFYFYRDLSSKISRLSERFEDKLEPFYKEFADIKRTLGKIEGKVNSLK